MQFALHGVRPFQPILVMLSAVERHKSPALALNHDLCRTILTPNERRTHIVVDSFIDQVNFGGKLCRVQVN